MGENVVGNDLLDSVRTAVAISGVAGGFDADSVPADLNN